MLQFAFDVKSTKCFVKNYAVDKVVGVDLGIINDAVCSAINKTGTVTGQIFINSPVEKDRLNHLLNNIKRCQQDGNSHNYKLWRWIKNYNKAIEINTARNIVQFALGQNAQVIVFEKLTSGKLKAHVPCVSICGANVLSRTV